MSAARLTHVGRLDNLKAFCFFGLNVLVSVLVCLGMTCLGMTCLVVLERASMQNLEAEYGCNVKSPQGSEASYVISADIALSLARIGEVFSER